MKIIPASFRLEPGPPDGKAILRHIEMCGRTCYKSEGNNESCDVPTTQKFIQRILDSHHESVIEHFSLTVRIVCDRGVSHEAVRHRLASFSQESTRYCNYSKDKFGAEVTFIDIRHLMKKLESAAVWERACRQAEENYLELIQLGESPQIARSVLINSLKTEFVITANIREWRHIFKMRTSKAAHPQMREIMDPMLLEFQKHIPVLFDDIKPGE